MANQGQHESEPIGGDRAPENGQSTTPPADPEADSASNPEVPGSDDQQRDLLPRLPSLARILSVAMLILGIIAVGALFFKVMASFFVPLFLAVLLVLIFRPIHEWIFHRIGDRPRLASLATTALIMAVVLLPIISVIFVAASQVTTIASPDELQNLRDALYRRRDQLGLSLPHAEQFGRLKVLAESLDRPEGPGTKISREDVIANVNEALTLVTYLQDQFWATAEVDEASQAETQAGEAKKQLRDFKAALRRPLPEHSGQASDPLIVKLEVEEALHEQSLSASAAIRDWMRTLLGGTLRSQLRLLANPSVEDEKRMLTRARQVLQPRFVTVTSATGSFLLQTVIGLVVLVIAVYFFLLDGPAMVHTLMRLSPLDDNYEQRLLIEFERTNRAVVMASVSSALVQGFLAAIAFWLFGFHSVILLFLVTSLMALVPFLGAASVWVPCAIYLGVVEQRWISAIILAVYGAVVVSSIDNVIKMYVLHGRSTMHPLFALLSVLGGVKVFGPIGILVGPMVVVFLQTLLEILNHELAERDSRDIHSVSTDRAEPQTAEPATEPPADPAA